MPDKHSLAKDGTKALRLMKVQSQRLNDMTEEATKRRKRRRGFYICRIGNISGTKEMYGVGLERKLDCCSLWKVCNGDQRREYSE